MKKGERNVENDFYDLLKALTKAVDDLNRRVRIIEAANPRLLTVVDDVYNLLVNKNIEIITPEELRKLLRHKNSSNCSRHLKELEKTGRAQKIRYGCYKIIKNI